MHKKTNGLKKADLKQKYLIKPTDVDDRFMIGYNMMYLWNRGVYSA